MISCIEFVSPASPCGVRIFKISNFLKSNGYKLSFVGWNRNKKQTPNKGNFDTAEYILNGGGQNNVKMPCFYLLFIFKLFIKYLFIKKDNSKLFYAINFEAAMALWAVSKFRKINYCYDIWDELALSHNFPKSIKKIIRWFDKRIRKRSVFYIHVDPIRESVIDSPNHIIVYNSPYDIYENGYNAPKYENRFAVTGYFSDIRGLDSIFLFAKDNPQIEFIVAGEFQNKITANNFTSLQNVRYYHFMPQNKLFELISDCRGIFSLYDPSLEINRLAASNKLYDAMMLGIPVIVNNGIIAADYVKEHNIGYVVDYNYNDSWNILKDFNLEEINVKGENGRFIYNESFEFGNMCKNTLLQAIKKIN